jgi:hypothetical protein
MATESIREDAETAAAPWDTVSFPKPTRPTVTDINGRERELTDGEMRQWEESKADTAMRKEAAAAQQGTSTIDHLMRARPRAVKPLDENTIYQFTLSPSIHEDRVLSLTEGEHDDALPYLADATNFLRSTRTTLEKIDTAYKGLMLDKSLTADARSLKLEAATSTAFTTAYAKQGAAIEALARKISFTEGELSRPLEAQAATPRSTELRAVLREMKPGDRNGLIRAAIGAVNPSTQQTELLHSVLGAHHLMVGISEEEQAVHVRAYNGRTQPQIQRRLELLKKGLAVLGSIKPETVRSQFEGAQRSPFTRATAIRGISQKAQAALDAINAKE